jgi:hypothetical protein
MISRLWIDMESLIHNFMVPSPYRFTRVYRFRLSRFNRFAESDATCSTERL